MFWRFGGYANLSSLDSILDKPDVTIEEVLDENDTIAELKSQNAKLIDFLREEAVLGKLLQFVIRPFSTPSKTGEDEPTSPEKTHSSGGFLGKAIGKGRSKSRGHEESEQEKQERQKRKYAYVSSEILSSDVWSISESLLDNLDQLKPFWDYLKVEVPLDNLQASYFTKVNEALIEKQPARMITFIKSLENVIPDMMKHVDCPMIMDLLLKLISLEKDPAGQGIVDWIQSQNLIPILLSYITPEHPPSTQTAAGDFLKAIITISANASSQDASVIGPNELTRELVSKQCLEALITEMLRGGNPLTVGVGIVIEVIRKNNSDYDAEIQMGPDPRSSDPIYLGNLLRLFSEHIGDFMELILSPSHTVTTETGTTSVRRKEMKVAWGERIEPLGFDRFKTCELMAELLHCSNMGLLNEKGSEAEVRKRDIERERLKAEGRLGDPMVSTDQSSTGADFGTSVDSQGFHHAEAFTPLGESPEDINRSDIRMRTEDDGFEKVALSEADPEPTMDDLNEKQERDDHTVPQAGEMDPEKADYQDAAEGVQMLKLESDPTTDTAQGETAQLQDESSVAGAQPTGKRRVSNLTLQIQSAGTALSRQSDSDTSQNPDSIDRPAPLSIKKTAPPLVLVQQAQDSSDNGPSQAEDDEPEFGESQSQVTESQASQVELPPIQREDDGAPVLGDLLKIMFVEHHVVPTILDFFFRFPWNNFLHNVVYDVVQQVFNGPMDRGYNAHVANDLFETGRITQRVIEGQERSDNAQKDKGLRLGYMGHLTLIAEEIVKFIERQPQETLSQSIVSKVSDPVWMRYVEQTLAQTRERDNAILGGVRPDMSVGPRQAVLNAVNAQQGGFGNGGSAALANAGLTNNGAMGLDSMDLANAGNSSFSLNNNSLLSGFGSSDEEDDDLDEGSGSDTAGNETNQQQQVEDEEQSQQNTNTNEPTTSPAPLAPPSRARLQLAQRLADRQKQADGEPEPSSQTESTQASNPDDPKPRPQNSTKSALTSSSKPTSPSATRRLRFDDEDQGQPHAETSSGPQDEVETIVGSVDERTLSEELDRGTGDLSTRNDDDNGSSDDDDLLEARDELARKVKPQPEDGRRSLKRQSTRESLERIPLDVGDEEDEANTQTAAINTPTSATATQTANASSSQAPVSSPPSAGEAYEAGLAAQRELEEGKKVEQERLLAEWGLAEEDDGVDDGMDADDADDEDDEDEAVSIGSRFMSRRGSGK